MPTETGIGDQSIHLFSSVRYDSPERLEPNERRRRVAVDEDEGVDESIGDEDKGADELIGDMEREWAPEDERLALANTPTADDYDEDMADYSYSRKPCPSLDFFFPYDRSTRKRKRISGRVP